jgi:serine/threonine protein kinase
MPVSIPELWNLMLASRLASPVSLSNLQARFNQVKGAETESNAATLAQWLIAQGALSLYQAKVLLAGQPGPFIYGDYTVYDRVGSGRLVGAFRALHPATRLRVLLWFHSGPVVHNQQWWSVLVDQIALAAQVAHRHVARVYHLCDLGQFKFTAIEDLQGDSADVQLAAGPIHWAVAARMVRQAALGLGQMHELKQLHGAIRPENLWIDKEENVKLLMTPLARSPLAVPGPIDLSAVQQSDEVLRQADYLAPEMGHAGQAPGPWTDMYALGCTFFHLLAGRPPYSGRDVLSKLASHSSERIPSLESASVPAPIGQILAAMLAKDPARRVQKPRQVADALAQVLGQLDPAQLRWPESAVSNKLPEYESWLQPYQLAPESQRNWAPEIQTPPILAASLRAEEPTNALEFVPHPTTQSQPTIAPSTAADVSTASRTWSDPLRTTPLPVRSAPHPSPTGGNLSVRGSGPVASRGGPSSSDADLMNHSLPAMVFPPDEADAVIPFASTDFKQHNRGNQRTLLTAAAVAAFMLTLIILWASMRTQSHDDVQSKDKPGSTSTLESNKEAPNPVEAGRSNDTNKAPSKAPTKNSNDFSGSGRVDTLSKSSRYRGLRVRFANYEVKAADAEPVNSAGAKDAGAVPQAAVDSKPAFWASPTQGSPLSVSHLAPGVQAILVLRPADLMLRSDRGKIFGALGPAGEAAARELKSFTGASLAEIEQLTIAWIEQIDASAETSMVPMYVFRFSKPADRQKLKARWEYAATIQLGLVYQTSQGFSAYLPEQEDGKVLVVGPAECLQEVARLESEPPPVYRPIEKLLLATDDQRLATLLWMPNAQISPDESPTVDPWRTLLTWARKFLGEQTRGAALSLQLADDNLFLELTVQGPLDRAPAAVAHQLQERLSRLPNDVDRYIGSLNLQPYAKPVLLRFSQMIKVMSQFTRGGTQGDLAVLRCYLPATAAHNLLMASELAVAESAAPNAPTGGGIAGQPSGPAMPETVAQKLQHVTSLSFARDTLEKAIQMLADDIGVKAEIIGPDLQLEGITKNQSFTLDETNKPVAEILGIIMLRANPDGKLVYVIKARESGEETLFITTRAAAAKRGDKLPPELAKAPAVK